jgi:hypothetical protein
LSFGEEGKGRKGEVWEEVKPCLRVLKILIRKGFGGLILSNFKVPTNWGVLEG